MSRTFLILPLAYLAFASVLLSVNGNSLECIERADSMRTESARLEEAGKYDRAAELDSLSALLYRACGNPEEEGRAFERTGFCLWRMGELDLALVYYRRAQNLYAEHGRPADTASLMNRIGLVYWKKDIPDTALSMFEEVMRIGRETGDSALVARGLGNAGMVYRHIGQYGQALECYRRCLSLHKIAGDSEKEALALGNMGVLFSSRGQYREALLCLHEALEISRQVKDVRTEGRVLGNMGIVYWNLGLIDDARDLYEEQLLTARHLQNRLDEATCLDNLGNLKWALADYEAALALYHEAMAIYQELGNRRSEGTIAYDIAQVFLSLGRPEEAREWLEKALEIHRSVRDRWSEALDLTAVGDIALASGDGPGALDAFDKTLILVGESGAMEIAWYGKFGKGRALDALGKREEAGRLYKESIEVIEQMRSKVNLESLSTRFLESKMEPYVALTRLLIAQGLLEEAFLVCESAHARTLLEVMSTAEAGIEVGVPEDLIKRKAECEEKINELDRKLVTSYAKPGAESLRQEDLTSGEKALLDVRKRYEEICREIDLNRIPAAGVAAVVEPPGAREVQGLLAGSREGAALLEYLAGRESLITFLVTADTVMATVQAVGRDSLSHLSDLFRRPFLDLRNGQTDLANLDFPVDVSRVLYDITVRPLEPALRGSEVLLVVPDASLHYIPFEALVAGIGERKSSESVLFSRYREYEYLLDRHVIACAPSASLFLETRKMVSERHYRGELYAVGDPSVGEERMVFPYVGELIGMLRGDLTFRFAPLPGAREEVESLREFSRGRGVTVRTGRLATEKEFKERAPGHRFIHLATHGVADDREPLYSRLVLGIDEEGTNDGFLHAYEVSQMDLGCELVVLSACETALGPLGSGEGLLGLSRSFFLAGSPSVIASLWSVDESTALVMQGFYRNLGKGKGRALRLAKLEVLDREENGMSLAHPFFWAPFVLLGDWR
jgi:CHAT domain-containing protein/tetratricopeptide (TPR) repeat protein